MLRDFLLADAKRRGTITLEGNREFWSKLDWAPATGFTHYGGDSMTGEEEFRKTVDDDGAYALLLAKCRDRANTWGKPGLDDAELLAWLEQNVGLW
jgi:hypothetical protein